MAYYSVLVNKLAGQGLLYIPMKQAYNFVLQESDAGQDQSGWLDQDCLSLTGQLKDPPVPLHVMIRQGSSLVQVQVYTSTHQTEEPTIFTTDPQRALSKSKNRPAGPWLHRSF